jgi:hypothetical protein
VINEFEEIGHSGGKVTFSIATIDGRRGYQVGYSSNRPVPMSLIAVYALPQGVPVESIQLGGIGQPWNPPPFPDCFPVFIASDSQGKFGHRCPNCDGYWRSGPWPNICPYCDIRAASFQFLSEAQQRYVRHYCEVLSEALAFKEDGEVVIDMDIVADAVGKESEKPAFYVSEQSQQRKFTCGACEEFNDILGRFGYCSLCGTRNDLADFEGQIVPNIRKRLNDGTAPEDCLRDAVAAFDTFVAQVAKQLTNMVPMTERRKKRLLTQRFHNLEDVCKIFKDWFDIDISAGIKADEFRLATVMFHRRHVYEHNGGEVDQKYLDNSGDSTVRLKQHIRESKQGVHDLLSSLLKMVRNIHCTFHELIPPIPGPIKAFEDKKARMAKYAKDNL